MDNYSPLNCGSGSHSACCKNQLSMLTKKYAQLNIDQKSKCQSGRTGLHFACLFSSPEMVEMILQKSPEVNIDLDAKSENDKTAIHYAIDSGQLKTVKTLIQKSNDLNINLNEKGPHGMTALQYACKMGRPKMVQMFIDNSDKFDINLNATDPRGMTAFHYACINDARFKSKVYFPTVKANNQQIFEIILQKSTSHNIDLDAKNKNGLTPLDFVNHFENHEMAETLEQKLSKKPKYDTPVDKETLRLLCEKDFEAIFFRKKKQKCCD